MPDVLDDVSKIDRTELFKALICIGHKYSEQYEYHCESCPYDQMKGNGCSCNYFVSMDAMKVITYQFGEIERLKQDANDLERLRKNHVAEIARLKTENRGLLDIIG